jgi:hypothetical protein
MIRVAVSPRAYCAIKASLPEGAVVLKPERDGRGRYLLLLASSVIRIVITAEAYLAICATLPLGSVMSEPEVSAKGERLIWLDDRQADKLAAMRGEGESYSDVIMRLAAGERK